MKINVEPDVGQQVWFTSDTHYAHKNICSATSEWDGSRGTRDFDSVEQMNKEIVDQINYCVEEDDILFHLGDWSFGGLDKIGEFRERLRCRNIHLIFGNHDHHIVKSRGYRENRLCDMFSSADYAKEIIVNGQLVFLSHYSHRVWNKSHKGSYHFYGHSHGSIEHTPHGKSMDVGIDNAYNLTGEYRPFNWFALNYLMQKREVMYMDHHDKNTH